MLNKLWTWFVPPLRISHPNRQRPTRRLTIVEVLEARDLPATLQPLHVLVQNATDTAPLATAGPTGTTPSQIRHAYGFDQISFAGGTVAADGSGTTIAIVDAYDDPRIANDLHQFDLKFGLSDPVFTKVNQTGGSVMPAADAGWATEIALDVEWAHAIAPKVNILLVEANSASDSDLFAAVSYAARQPGVVAVSMSFGGGEYSGQKAYDSSFLTPTGHAGVTFIVSSGDSGAPASYPASSPNVLAVGGTTANLDAAGNMLSESAWSGSGGGLSSVESQPSWQLGFVTQSTTRRGNPDVSYDSDPNTGFPVYDSYNNSTSAPWSQFGGTSDAAPQWAGLIAIADQGRALAGLSALDGVKDTLPKIYAMPASNFSDVVSGSSAGSPAYAAGSGYDLATGRGSPHANLVVGALIGQSTNPVGTTHFGVSISTTTPTAGTSFVVTVTALDVKNAAVTSYTGAVHLSSTDGSAVLPANYTFTAGDKGVHKFTVTLKTAGSQTVTATDTGGNSGSVAATVKAAVASQLVFGPPPTNVAPGAVITPAVTVRVVDAYGNLVSTDNTDKVTLKLGSNPGAGTLAGTTVVTVQAGVATFANLSINNLGTGYTLVASSGTLKTATSTSFNVLTASVIENFESTESWNTANGFGFISALRTSAAAHDGTYGIDDYEGDDWVYRTGGVDQIKAGDTVSVWLQLAGAADGRAYFGFGATSVGTLALVAAPNTGQLVLQLVSGYDTYTQIAAVNQTYVANHWYRLEVNWGSSGTIVGKLYDSNGTTLLNSVTGASTAITSGGIGFRAIGSDKYWDTVTASHGVNSFAKKAALPTPASKAASSMASPTAPATVYAAAAGASTASTTTAASAPAASWYWGIGSISEATDWERLLRIFEGY